MLKDKAANRSQQSFFALWAVLLVALEQGSDVSCAPHAQALSDPLQRHCRLSPQARRDANLPRIALALQATDFAVGGRILLAGGNPFAKVPASRWGHDGHTRYRASGWSMAYTPAMQIV